MKKSLSAVLVIALSLVGANALAAKFDVNVRKVAIESNDKTGSENEKTGGACRTKLQK